MSGSILGVYPSFPIYVGDWFGSRAVYTMTPEQRGAYLNLLLHAWPTSVENLANPCTLPADEAELAILSGLGAERWATVGAKVRAQFQSAGEGFIRNAKQHAVWLDMLARSEQRSGAGKKGMASRWGGDKPAAGNEGDNTAITEPQHEEGPSPSDVAFAEAWGLMLTLKRPNNPRKLALKAWTARVSSGEATPDELLDATKRYVAYCAATGKVGTETTMQGSTFYGPNERWKESFAVLTVATGTGKGAGLDAARARWEFYRTHDLVDNAGDYPDKIAKAVAAGAWPSVDAAQDELRKVRPWDVSRMAQGNKDRAVREVAARLGMVA